MEGQAEGWMTGHTEPILQDPSSYRWGGPIKKFIGHKNIINTYRTQGYNSVIRGYFCIGFTDFML